MKQLLKFNYDYNKLKGTHFTTIRISDKYRIGEVVRVKSPSHEFEARLVNKKYLKLNEIPTGFLAKDTDKQFRENAEDLLKEVLGDFKPDERLVVLWFVKE